MRDDYKILGPIEKIQLEVESEVVAALQAMSVNTQLTASEIANTAFKRFITSHKDFLPADYSKSLRIKKPA